MFRRNWWGYVEIFLWGGILEPFTAVNPAEDGHRDPLTTLFTPWELARLRVLKRRYQAQVQTKYPPAEERVEGDERVVAGLDERRLGFVRWLVAHHRFGEGVTEEENA